jgi:hypothetical protein
MPRFLTAVLAAGLAVLPAPAADEAVTLRRVKYDDLAKFIAAQKGKVVVVDFWATY